MENTLNVDNYNYHLNHGNYTQISYVFPVVEEENLENSASDYAKFFKKVMGGLDLEQYLPEESRIGRNGYDARALLETILFAYSNHVYSLRKMEYACRYDINYKYISQGLAPSYMTICRFIKHLKGSIQNILIEVNKYIEANDKIDDDTVYIDGTKMEANASKFTFVWKKATLGYQKKLFAKTDKAVNELNEFLKECNVDLTYIAKGTYTPEDYTEIMNELDLIKENAPDAFVYGVGHRKDEFQKQYEKFQGLTNKAFEYAEKIAICGKRNSYSKTDHDATFMHGKEDYYMKTGIFRAEYNVQVAVSDEYIRYIDVFQECNDVNLYIPVLEGLKNMYGHYPKYPVADAGYGSYDNYMFDLKHNIELVQKYNYYEIDHKNKSNRNVFTMNSNGTYVCPNGNAFTYIGDKEITTKGGNLRIKQQYATKCDGCPFINKCHSNNCKDKSTKLFTVDLVYEEMKDTVIKNLESELGIVQRTRRSIEAEGTFGIFKQDWDYDRIHRRGIDNVRLEVTLAAIGFNLKKLYTRFLRNKSN